MLGFDESYEICNCKKVSIEEIIVALEKEQNPTLSDIQDLTGAGTECRYCIFKEGDNGKMKKNIYCKDVLNKIKNERING